VDNILLRPIKTEIEYHGQFAAVAFKLLANPIPIYEGFLEAFRKYGVSLRDIKYEGSVLSEANISCTLLNFNVLVRVRLDRLEVTFFRLDIIDEKAANQIAVDAWNVVKATDDSVGVVQHGVTVATHVELPSTLSYDALLQRYVVAPLELKRHTRSGVVFYLGEDQARGQTGGSILLDRSILKDGALYIKVSAVFDAAKIPINSVGASMDGFFTSQLGNLGLVLERAERK